jgi:hypothetical protein
MLREKLEKVMKGKKNLSDAEKAAKMDVVSHLRDLAAQHMHHKMASPEVHKAVVAADSPEDLKAGLDKAKQVVDQEENPDQSPDMSMDQNSDDDSLQMSEGGDVPEHDTSDSEMNDMVDDAENTVHDALSAHEEHGSPAASEMQGDMPEDMDEDELNAKLEKLMALKKKRSSKKSENPY